MENDATKEERLSHTLMNLAEVCRTRSLTLGELVDHLHIKGPMFSCLVFAAPFLMPVPLPGLSTAFGAVILLSAVFIILDRDLWVPKKWSNRIVPAALAEKVLLRFVRLLSKVEHLVRPRLGLADSASVRITNGTALLILALLLCLPMPPGFNAPPALAICILATASLEDDGLWIIVGWVLTILNVALFTVFFVFGWVGIKKLLHLD